MEQEIILYFKLKKEPQHAEAAKKGKKPAYGPISRYRWKKQLEAESRTLSCRGSLADRRIVTYMLPPLPDMAKRNEKLRKHIEKQIHKIVMSYSVPYIIFYARELEDWLHVQTQPNERFLTGMAEEIMQSGLPIEEALLIEGEDDPFPLLETIYPTLNALFIITGQPGKYEEFLAAVLEDTGLAAACQGTFAGSFLTKGTPLVIDMHAGMKLPCAHIPRGALYVDLCPSEAKRRAICLKREDVCYVDFGKFLDSH